MTFEQLLYAEVLSHHTSMQKAADMLHITKSGLSMAIGQLEEELGVKANEKELIYCGDRKVIWDAVFFGKEFHDRQISRVFLLWLDREASDFTLQESEVDGVLWMDFDACYQGVQDDLFENCIVLEELDMLRKALEE